MDVEGILYIVDMSSALTNVGSSGQVLISGGATNPPAFGDVSTAGAVTSVVGSANIQVTGTDTRTVSVTGIMPVANGGTNQDTYTTNGPVYFDGTQLDSVTPGSVDQVLCSGGSLSSPVYKDITTIGAVTSVAGSSNINVTGTSTRTVSFTGTLPVANGGTNNTSFTANGTTYFDGTKLSSIAPGTTGNVLISAGVGSAPSYQDITTIGAVTSVIGSTNINVTGTSARTVSLTGTVPIANGGTNNASYTSNGTAYYDGTKISTVSTGTSTQVLVSNGSLSAPSYQDVSVTGAVTSVTGSTNIQVTGTSTRTIAFTGILPIANGGTNQSSFTTNGTTYFDGTRLNSIAPGTSGNVLASAGGASAPSYQTLASLGAVTSVTGSGNIQVTGTSTRAVSFTGTLPIANGGTNQTSFTTNGPVYFDGTSLTTPGAGTSGNYLKSNGSGSAPSWATLPTFNVPAASCAFAAIKTANQTLATAATTLLTFGTELYDVGNNFASNAFTAPTSGKLYMFNVQVYALNASLTDRLSLAVNGTPLAISQMAIVLGVLGAINISLPLMLNAGDVVTLVYTNSSILTTATVNGQSSPYNTWFSGYQLT